MTAPDVRKTVEALIAAAAAGKPDAVWIDEAIRRAGYIPRGERVTQAEVKALIGRLMQVLEDLALDCGETCGEGMMERIMRGMDRARDLGAGTVQDGPRGP